MLNINRTKFQRLTTRGLLFTSLLFTGCAVTPQTLTLQEMEQQRTTDLTTMFDSAEKIDHPLTLSEVVARALRYNLDHQVKVMEHALALDLSSLDQFEMLPKVVANAAYSGRSNVNASSSYSVTSGTESLALSTSQDRERITSDLGMTWNILDFGVSYYNARQNADRNLIAHERERKVIQNLVQETRTAFWRAVAVQQLAPRVQATVKMAEGALLDAKKAEESQLRSPLDSLRYRKTLLEFLRQLESIQQELSSARFELAAMMTLPPGTEFTLAVPEGALQVPVWSIPLEKMEELALVNQPDMREISYQGRIVVNESRKNLLKLFPGISFSVSHQRDSNSYALNNDWNEAGLRVTWNLLNLLSFSDQMVYNKTNEQVLDSKRLALRMALLAQVHVANRQFELSCQQLQRNDELFQVEKAIAKQIEARTDNDLQSVLDRISSDTSAILAEQRRYQSLALVQNALGKMMAITGQDPDVAPIQQGTLAELTERVEKWMKSQLEPFVSGDLSVPVTDTVVKASPVQETPLTVGQSTTVINPVWVRSGYGKNYKKLRALQAGDEITVLEISPDGMWSRIGNQEWVSVKYITQTN
ncbi:MAG: TolC family protein [Magnetococcus sp. DMHC-6]